MPVWFELSGALIKALFKALVDWIAPPWGPSSSDMIDKMYGSNEPEQLEFDFTFEEDEHGKD